MIYAYAQSRHHFRRKSDANRLVSARLLAVGYEHI